MKYLKMYCLIFLLSLLSDQLIAQASGSTKILKMILPDGSALGPASFDSLERAWGKGRVLFEHQEADDAKGIIHLVRVTDEMQQQMDLREKENKEALSAMLNKPAPGFELKDLTGRVWSLAALRGKIIVLNFWFTACTGCVQEMPELNKLTQAYDAEKVVFLALTFNNANQVRQFLQQHPFNYIQLPDSRAVSEKYNIRSWPTSMVIDQKGNIKTIMKWDKNIREELGKAIDGL